MVFLQRVSASGAGRKRPAGPLPIPPRPPPCPPPAQAEATAAEDPHLQPHPRPQPTPTNTNATPTIVPGGRTYGATATADGDELGAFVSVLADAGFTLRGPGRPSLPADHHKLRLRLESRFAAGQAPLLDQFLSGLCSYISKPHNLLRILIPASVDGRGGNGAARTRGESLARVLLLVAPLQPRLQHLLLEKLPEYFDTVAVAAVGVAASSSSSLDDDVARLIINQFRWLDFVIDPEGLLEKLMEVLSICPLPLKREIIGSLPEIVGEYGGSGAVVEALEKLLQEEMELVVPVLDAFSNLNLDKEHQEQVVTIALSCLRTVDAEHMPHLLRFLLVSANQGNVGRIIAQIREQLKFVGVPDPRASRNKQSKGKSVADGAEGLIFEALRSSLRFKNILCEAILKELKGLDQPRDHKVVDVWLLVLVYMNGGSLQKNVEKIMKKKIVEGCLRESLFDQCIQGHGNLVKEYFQSFLSISEYLLACIEERAREFGIHMYISLFEEFTDTYSRQEVLGAVVAHIGSGVSFEVSSALDAMILLTSKYSHEMIPISSHVNGILDYLEGFNNDSLRKVYETFCHLAFLGCSNASSVGDSIANELLMLVRKQVGNPDMRYRRMGIIGTLKIVSTLGDINASKTNCEEALELLKVSLDSCKLATSALILLYDELAALVEHATLQPAIMEWMGIHLGDFESLFISDLKGGQLLSKDLYFGLEGKPWMNLDGDVSPICLNTLQVLCASLEQGPPTIQMLPAQFLLLSVVERSTNQGSLGGIDALLGCPLHLPSPKYLDGSLWKSLTEKQKRIICLSLFYAINWIRELLNAFSTQVAVRAGSVTQATREETVTKLMKRVRNIVLMESLLNACLKLHPLSLPELHVYTEFSGSPSAGKLNQLWSKEEKNECQTKLDGGSLDNRRKQKNKSTFSEKSDFNAKLRQPTIVDTLKRAGIPVSQEVSTNGSPGPSSREKTSQCVEHQTSHSSELGSVEISAVPTILNAQKSKFRALHVDCLSILSFSKQIQASCCSDPSAELSLHLYLLRDFHSKLDSLYPLSKPSKASCSVKTLPGLSMMTASEFLGKVRPLFPSLRKHLDGAMSLLKEGSDACEEHWKSQHTSAGNPDLPYLAISNASVGSSVFTEVLYCYGKMLKVPELFICSSIPALRDLLEAFQPTSRPDDFISHIQPSPTPGNIDYLYCGAYSFLEGVLDTACSISFSLASEVLITLESLVNSIPSFLKSLEGKGKTISMTFILNRAVFPCLQKKLGASARMLLTCDWNSEYHENAWKDKGGILPRILHAYLRNNESPTELLVELACSSLPQVPSCKSKNTQDAAHDFPLLCPAMFAVWYRTLHEENLAVLNKLIKEIVLPKSKKSKMDIAQENVKEVLGKLQQSVDVVVSLVNMCKTHDKVIVHALAVKYGGKFVDIFLKAFEFLERHYVMHNDIVIQMVKELQKATRTIHILCSEAKGSKRTMVTSKVPATKRSMERFLFRVKALLHNTSNGCTFWIGNLKHKDLFGQVVSSQVYANEDDEEALNPAEADARDSANSDSPQGDAME